jgi:hypothetical protein
MLTALSCVKGADGCQSGCWAGTSAPAGNYTSSPTSTPTPAAGGGGLTWGEKAGIIVGAFLFATLVVVLLYFYLRHRREQETIRQNNLRPPPAGPSSTNLNFFVTDQNGIRQILQQNPQFLASGTPFARLAIDDRAQAQYFAGPGRVYDGTTVAGS